VRTTWDNLQFGLRLGKKPRQFISTTPKPLKLLKEIIADPNTVVRRGSTYDNRDNLADTFFSQIVRRYEGTRIGRQELCAEILEDTPGALWTRDLLEECRLDRSALPPLRRIVVAVDPSVSVGEDSDETGIVVCGLGIDGHSCYVLEDASGKMAPIAWAQRAVSLYYKWSGDKIVAEANQGGLMVEQTVRTVDQNISFKSVHASRARSFGQNRSRLSMSSIASTISASSPNSRTGLRLTPRARRARRIGSTLCAGRSTSSCCWRRPTAWGFTIT
jgi:phage terminase large subunit-like protein